MLGIQPEGVADAVAGTAGHTVCESNDSAASKKRITALIPCQIHTTGPRQVKVSDVRFRCLHINNEKVIVEGHRQVFVVRGERQGSRLDSERDRPDWCAAIGRVPLPVVFRSRERDYRNSEQHRDVS
jgi:hypothetical protein